MKDPMKNSVKENIKKSTQAPTKELTQEELKIAYIIWQKHYNFNFVDGDLGPFLKEKVKSLDKKNTNWLANTRKAQFLSAQTVADKLNIGRSAYSQLEASEEKGTISLATLAKAAEALNCELVYAIRPKNRKSYASQIWEKLLIRAIKHPWLENCDQRKRGPALARIALETMNNPEFRRQQNWSNKANLLN